MMHVLIGPADFDARIPDHSNCLYWHDDLSVGPVPSTDGLAELSCVREEFWNASTDLKRLDAAERERVLAGHHSLTDRDQCFASLAKDSEIVVWYGPNRQELLMLLSVLHFLARSSTKSGQVFLVQCPKWGPQVYQPDELATVFDSRQVISRERDQLAADAWAAYTKSEPSELNNLTQSLRSRSDPWATAFSWILEEYPSSTNGLSRNEENLLREIGQGSSIVRAVGRVMGNSDDRVGDGMLFERLWGFASDEPPAIEGVDGTLLPAAASAQEFRLSRVRLTEFGRHLLAGRMDYVAVNGVNRWIGGVHLSGKAIPWRYDATAGQIRSA